MLKRFFHWLLRVLHIWKPTIPEVIEESCVTYTPDTPQDPPKPPPPPPKPGEFSIPEQYTVFKIPKRNHRGFRQIEAPSEELKAYQRELLQEIKRAFPISMFVHSFRSQHNVGTNAVGHMGANYIMHLDASNFFPSITYREFCRRCGWNNPKIRELIRPCFCKFPGEPEERLPQGAPTSPWLSNVYLWKTDNRAANFCYRRSLKFAEGVKPMCYSRYADDINISGPTTKDVYAVAKDLKDALERMHIKLNDAKTHIIRPGERHQVCSVVCHTVCQPKRKWRHRLRAQIHNEMRDLGHLTASAKGKLAYLQMLRNTPELYGSHQMIEQAKATKMLGQD